jgi:hypothetical protein
MMDRLMALLALAVLAAFLGILVWKVPRPDLVAVTGITLGLALWDFISGDGRKSGRG